MSLERFEVARILLVDDEPAFRLLAERFLTQQGYQVSSAADLTQARQLLAKTPFDLLLLDLSLPPLFDPAATLTALPELNAQPVIILTGHADRELALQAISLGAWDFIAKPVDPDLLAVVVKRAISKHQLELELTKLKRQSSTPGALQTLVGVSRQMDTIRTLIQRIAPTEVRVLVTGPSGTGKEVISRALHQLSLRANGPFVSVHCGAIPADLLESELFGYMKGAFTGADKDRQGLLAMANGGTLFLDEIGEMPLPMQVKMLRVLQEGTYYPVGGREQKRIDVRLVSATNAVLPDLVAQGKFREDLYYRIKGITLETPALDDRREDIPLLIQHFLQQLAQAQPKGGAANQSLTLAVPALQWFLQRSWPGNVRELKNTLESVVAISQHGVVQLSDIELLHMDAGMPAQSNQLPGAAGGSPLSAAAGAELATGLSLDEQVRNLEISLLMSALQQSQGNRSQAARALGLSRQGLLKKIERYGLLDIGQQSD
ncbi:sigma-54-dependent Fis family transcriptional regulator [Rheinheimera riviphila]|uniref:Sigma-54-dependent Fis family transcriptional regulator n=1 Tax=Rheinheimera riviphila TaxID=1834037 RepID=A0A437R5I5_9GAMM|nr:sigma-54 dependent transcriptional regulator [Rheinheimera riviphila]RVU41971.1 sigma-54-dependent Fis family transcriptional regulator [Rheinheimera riviphila]